MPLHAVHLHRQCVPNLRYLLRMFIVGSVELHNRTHLRISMTLDRLQEVCTAAVVSPRMPNQGRTMLTE